MGHNMEFPNDGKDGRDDEGTHQNRNESKLPTATGGRVCDSLYALSSILYRVDSQSVALSERAYVWPRQSPYD